MVRRFIPALFTTVSLLVSPLAPAAWAAPVDLTILHTNDTHDHLESFESRKESDVGGVARRATYIRGMKATTRNVLVLDGGDAFQGTPIFTFFSGEPDYIALQQLGYDAVTVGNHDMDNGLLNLKKQAKHLLAPPISATLTDENGRLLFPPYRTFERGGLKIAVIGIMGDNAYKAIAEQRRKGVKVLDPTTELKKWVPKLRATSDLVVVLSHTGHEEELAIAREVKGIDVIVGGHSHSKIDHPKVVKHADRDTLVVQAFQWGEYMGNLHLTVDDRKVTAFNGNLIRMSPDIPEDPAVKAMIAKYADKIKRQMAEVVGRSNFEFINSRKAESDAPIGNVIADALREVGKTDVAIMNSGGIRAPIPKGNVTRGMVLSMLPFDNYLVTFKVKGAVLQSLLDFAASRLGRSGSLQVSGVSYVVDGEKATQVLVGDKPLDPAKTYSVGTIDYLAAGNDGADVFKQVGAVHETGLLVRDVFIQFMKQHPMLENPPGGRITRKQ